MELEVCISISDFALRYLIKKIWHIIQYIVVLLYTIRCTASSTCTTVIFIPCHNILWKDPKRYKLRFIGFEVWNDLERKCLWQHNIFISNMTFHFENIKNNLCDNMLTSPGVSRIIWMSPKSMPDVEVSA